MSISMTVLKISEGCKCTVPIFFFAKENYAQFLYFTTYPIISSRTITFQGLDTTI